MTFDFHTEGQAKKKRRELMRLGYAVSMPWQSESGWWHITAMI